MLQKKYEYDKELLIIHTLIKRNRYDSFVSKDALKKEFDRKELSNIIDILKYYITNGILVEKDKKIYITSKGIKYINMLAHR
jgi:coproporphyrinogen III oxidase-like Fe-S oxidoreductase